jgi:hypothetical protein
VSFSSFVAVEAVADVGAVRVPEGCCDSGVEKTPSEGRIAVRQQTCQMDGQSCVCEKPLAGRFAAAQLGTINVLDVLSMYNGNPHSIYLINLVVSLLNFIRRLAPGTFYDAFGKIF